MVKIEDLKTLAQNYNVLYVEDEESIRKGVVRYLENFFKKVDSAVDGEEGLALYKKHPYDLVITDISMPKMNGLDMATKIKKIDDKQEILIVSAYSQNDLFMKSISIGVSGYVVKPIDFKQINNVLYKVLYKLEMFKENELYKTNLEKLLELKTKEQRSNYETTLASLVSMIEKRDTYTGGHSERVASYCELIAKAMGYSDEDCALIYRVGILHDIGKIATPDAILLKPGKLNNLEYKLIQEHANVGQNMLVDIPMYHQFAKIIAAHHEHYDGSGYPNGLKGDEIPPLARIMMVADAFDAMTTSRIYKARKSVPKAIEELKSLSGIHFHPEVISAAVTVLSDVTVNKAISQLPTSELEQERFAYFYKDIVTDLYNVNYLDLVLSKNAQSDEYSHLYIILLHNFAHYNELHGWNKGDNVLMEFASELKNKFSDTLLFRIHGDDFVLLQEKNKKIDENMINVTKLLEGTEITWSIKKLDIKKNNITSLSTLEKIILS